MPVLAALVALTAAAPGQAASPGPPDPSRIASVRIFQDQQFTAKHQTPASIGAALAGVRPTYVSSLIRYAAGQRVRPREVRAWRTIVPAVRAASPEARFAVELNPIEFRNAGALTRMMGRIRTALGNDGWLMDFWSLVSRKRPGLVRAALANAHANGEFVGGNVFGIARHPRIPSATDYVAVQDFGFHLNLKAIHRLSRRFPVHLHLMNSPDRPLSVGCIFMEQFSTAHRIRYVRKRARQQGPWGFHLGYPVFFPECERHRGQGDATIFSYDAVRDPPMLATIGVLMDRYSSNPATSRAFLGSR